MRKLTNIRKIYCLVCKRRSVKVRRGKWRSRRKIRRRKGL